MTQHESKIHIRVKRVTRKTLEQEASRDGYANLSHLVREVLENHCQAQAQLVRQLPSVAQARRKGGR